VKRGDTLVRQILYLSPHDGHGASNPDDLLVTDATCS
jgi:hypothetical protein